MACERVIKHWIDYSSYETCVTLGCTEHGRLLNLRVASWETVMNPYGLLGAIDARWAEHIAAQRDEIGQLPVHLL